MNRFILYWAVAGTCLLATQALAQLDLRQPVLAGLAAYDDSYTRPNAEESPSDQPEQHVPGQLLDVSCPRDSDPACGCEDASCGCGGGCGLLGDCCLGDAWTLKEYLSPCCDVNYGGWFEMGYYSDNERLSSAPSDGLAFRDFPDHLNLDQAWLYVEKVADANGCSADYGYRLDVMYGVDAQFAQAYGNPRALNGPNLGAWDASLDNGPYGWAMPQLYGEVANGDWSVKVGHFFTPVGYEVIPAPGNFFYSHTLTHVNTEPFTHTGVLGTYNGYDNFTPIVGWALGWDTGFEQLDGGNVYVGGFTTKMNDDVTFTYMNTIGNLGWRSGGEFGFTQHIVGVVNVSKDTVWVIQSDYLDSDGTPLDPTFHDTEGGVTNYLLYTINDCWQAGARVEWWKSNVPTGESTSFYDMTYGFHYWPTANVVIRPEIRYDWTPAEDAVGDDYNQLMFGIDAVVTF
ncbi:MAG: porin [Planctomycetes bacterium]|nr:porin [Planctomycetota bacterium]